VVSSHQNFVLNKHILVVERKKYQLEKAKKSQMNVLHYSARLAKKSETKSGMKFDVKRVLQRHAAHLL